MTDYLNPHHIYPDTQAAPDLGIEVKRDEKEINKMADITREEAARVLTDFADSFSKHELTKNTACISALRMGAAALRGWVKTSDRLPKARDENGFGVIVAYNPELGNEHDHGFAACIRAWCVDPQSWPYWMPLPKLPEVG